MSFRRSFKASHRAPLPPRSGQDRDVDLVLLPETVSLPARCFGSQQPLFHPREERLASARQRDARLVSGRRCRRSQAEGEGRAGTIERPQRLPAPRLPPVLVSFRRRHDAPKSAGQREAGSGRRVRLGGVGSFQDLQARWQHPACCLCQGFLLQISGRSTCGRDTTNTSLCLFVCFIQISRPRDLKCEKRKQYKTFFWLSFYSFVF